LRTSAVLGAVAFALAAFAILPPQSHATGLDVTCSPTSVVVVGCDQLVPYTETFSPGDLGAYRFVSRGPARNVNRLSVRTASTNTESNFELSLWDGTNTKPSNRLGSCTITNAQADAWNSCTIPDVWVPAGAVRYLAILDPESNFEDWQAGRQIWIRTAGQWGNAPEYEHSNRNLETTPATFTKGNTYTGASPANFVADDVVAPTVTFGDRPADLTDSATAAWTFTANEPSTFECALDGGAYAACTSPHQLTGIAAGAHTLFVRATDAAGNVTTVSDDWTVTPPGPPANLWIDGGAGTCTRSAAGAPYDPATACESLDEAYHAAESGDLVLVKAGDYGAQETASNNASLTDEVTVRAADGETVTFADLDTHGDWLHVEDIAIPTGSNHHLGWRHHGGSHVTLENVDISGPYASINVEGGDHVTYRDSEFGTADNQTARLCGTDDGQPMQVALTDHFTVDHVTFHPFQADTDPVRCNGGVLTLDTVRIWGGVDDMRLVNSIFEDGDGSNSSRIYVTKPDGAGSGDNSDNLVIASNYIGSGANSASIYLSDHQQCLGYRIAYNFWRQAFIDGCAQQAGTDGLLFIANLATMPSGNCPGTQPGRRNLWVAGAIGHCGTDHWLTPDFGAYELDGDGYHLTVNSPAVDAGEDLELCEELTGGKDIDGDDRGPICDAGPDELPIAPGPEGPATLWIDHDGGGTCVRSADASYDHARACGSLNAAYQRARGGDHVLIKGGDYGDQKTTWHSAPLSEAITVEAAPGETVTFTRLDTAGDWLHLEGVEIATGTEHDKGWWSQDASHVTLENVNVTGPYASIQIQGGAYNGYLDSEFGTAGNLVARSCVAGDPEPMQLGSTDHFTVDRVTFHPFQPELGNPACDDPAGNMHLETVRVNGGVDNLEITNSIFEDGDGSGTARIFITKLDPPGQGDNSDNIVIANNYLGDTAGSYSIHIGGNMQCVGYVIAYNFWRNGFLDGCEKQPNTDDLRFIGNLATMPGANCPGTLPGRRNLWVDDADGSCGTDDWLVVPTSVEADQLPYYQHAADGYHLTAGSPAIDAGEDYAACQEFTGGVDIDGDPRGPTCDAGPDEYVP
jgi:hypothetical protein